MVASAEAFTAAANGRAEEAAKIQAGFDELQKKMAADDALSILVDPANLLQASVTVPEGLRVVDIVDVLAKNTDFSKAQWNKALDEDRRARPARLRQRRPGGLPVPGDVHREAVGQADRRAQGDGDALAPGRRRRRP